MRRRPGTTETSFTREPGSITPVTDDGEPDPVEAVWSAGKAARGMGEEPRGLGLWSKTDDPVMGEAACLGAAKAATAGRDRRRGN